MMGKLIIPFVEENLLIAASHLKWNLKPCKVLIKSNGLLFSPLIYVVI